MLTPYHKRGNKSFDAAVKEVERVEHEYKSFAKRITPANIAIFNQQNPHRFTVEGGQQKTETLLKLEDNEYRRVVDETTTGDFDAYVDIVKAGKEAKVDVWTGANGSFTMTLWHHSRAVWCPMDIAKQDDSESTAETQHAFDKISKQNGDMQIVQFECNNRNLKVQYAVYSHHSGQTTFIRTKHNLNLDANELHKGVLSVQVEPTDGDQQLTYTPMKHLVVTDDVLYYKNCEIPLEGCSDNGYTLTNKLLNMFVERDVKNKHVRSLVIAVANLSTPEGVDHAFKKGRYHLKNEMLKHDLNMLTTAQAQHPNMFSGAQHLSRMTEETSGIEKLKTRIHVESAVGKVCSVKYSAVVDKLQDIEGVTGFSEIGDLAVKTAKGIAETKDETKFGRHLPQDLTNMLNALKSDLKKVAITTDDKTIPRPIMDNQLTCEKYVSGNYTVYHSTHHFIPSDIAVEKQNNSPLRELQNRFQPSHKFFIHENVGFTQGDQGVPQDNSAYVLVEIEHCAPKDTTIVFANTQYEVNTAGYPEKTNWYFTKKSDTKFDPIKTRPSVLYEMVSWFQTTHNRQQANQASLASPTSARIVFKSHYVNKRVFVLRGNYNMGNALTSVLILKGHQTKKHHHKAGDKKHEDAENSDSSDEEDDEQQEFEDGDANKSQEHVLHAKKFTRAAAARSAPRPAVLLHKSPAKKVLSAAWRANLDVNDAKYQ